MIFLNGSVVFLYLLGTTTYLFFLFIQKKGWEKTGRYFLAAGFIIHTAALAYEFAVSGHIPVRNLHETLSVAAWAVICSFLILQYRFNFKILGVYAAPLALMIMVISLVIPKAPVQDPDIFKSFWLFLHILFIFLGEASFALACGVGVLYLIQERAIKRKKPGFFFRRLPSLELLDTIGYICILAGFTLMTIGLITGFVYAKTIWGKFWSADPKEIWSIITWLLYAALLHGRLMVGWRGRRSAIMAIIGFGVILFTFLGVNFFLEGHHEEFTRW